MPKYRAIIQTYDAGHSGTMGGETVLETDKTPAYIGLLDASGTPIYRVAENIPLGFKIGNAKG